MKKSCNGCKAFYMDRYYGTCNLGYKIKNTRITSSISPAMTIPTCTPLEECPKPLTNKKLVQISLGR